MRWKELSSDEQRAFYRRWNHGKGESVKALADEYGITQRYEGIYYYLNQMEDGEEEAAPTFGYLGEEQPVSAPAVQPVVFHLRLNDKLEAPRGRSMNAALILPDPQFGFVRDLTTGALDPFHDRRALDAVRQIAYQVRPQVSVFLGDLIDMSEWSDKFIRLPGFYFTTQPSLIEAAWYIAQIRGTTTEETVTLEGNHDIRMETQIVKHLTAAWGLRTVDGLDLEPVMGLDNLLGLSRMGVRHIPGYPDGEYWINDDTKVIHGTKVRAAPGHTASMVVREATATTVMGHIHKFEIASRSVRGRNGVRTITAYSPGCLCRVDGAVPGSSKDSNWQQGAGIIWYDNQNAFIEHIAIHNGQAYFRGQVFTGHDYTDELIADTGWKF